MHRFPAILFSLSLIFPICKTSSAQEKLHLKRTTDLYNPSEVAIGKRAPDFTASDIQGNTKTLSELHGKYVLIQVWSSAMQACLNEMPAWKNMKDYYSGKPIVLMGISVDKSKSDWQIYYARNNLQGNEVFTEAFKAPFSFYILKNKEEDRRRFFSYTLPQYILVSPDGIILDNRMKMKPSDTTSFRKFLSGLPGMHN